jgi:hypothetical protein
MYLAAVEGPPPEPVRPGHDELAPKVRRCTRRFEADSEDGVGLGHDYHTVGYAVRRPEAAAADVARAALAVGGCRVVALSRLAG